MATPEEIRRGLVAAPGYSSFSPVRDLQRADDARKQRNAVAAAGVTDKTARLTGGAVDKLMQDGAVATAQSVPSSPTFGVDTVRFGAEITPTMIPPAAPAAAPYTGSAAYQQDKQAGAFMPGMNILGPAREAQAARAAQVVGGGPDTRFSAQNAAPQPPSAVAQFADVFGERAKDFSTGALQTGIGAVGTVAGTLADAGRQGLAYISNGELRNPNLFANTAGDFMGQGVDRLTGAFDGTGAAVRQAIGAREAQPATAAQPAAPAQPAAVTNADVLAQDKANLAAMLPPAAAPAAADRLSPDILAQTNEGIANAIADGRSPTLPAERGNYNMYNTDRAALAARAAPTAGLTMGFTPGEATARMAGYRAADRADAAQAQLRKDRARAAVDRIGLRNAMTNGSPQERRAARMEMEALDLRQNLDTQQLGDTDRQRISSAGDVERARVTGEFGLRQAGVTGEYGLDAENIRGQYGLREADIVGNAAVGKALASTDPKAMQEAQLLQTRNQLLLTAIANNDEEAIRFYSSNKYAPVQQASTDAMTGIPLTPEEIAVGQRINLNALRARDTKSGAR